MSVEKIRILYNRLKDVIDEDMPKLEFTNVYIKFELYKSNFDSLFLINKYNTLFKLSLCLFRDLFEKDEYFTEYTEEKERFITNIIEFITTKKTTNLILEIAKLTTLNKSLAFLNNLFSIDMKVNIEYVYLLLLHCKIKGFSTENFFEFLIPKLNESYSDADIELENIYKSKLNVSQIISKFNKIFKANKDFFNGNFRLKWDNDTNEFIFTAQSNEDIIESIKSMEKERKSKKENKKDTKLSQDINKKIKKNDKNELPNKEKDDENKNRNYEKNNKRQIKEKNENITKENTKEKNDSNSSDLKNKIKSMEETISKLITKVEDLEKKDELKNKQIADLEKKDELKNEKIADLEKKDELKNEKIADLQNKTKKLSNTVNQLKNNNKEISHKLTENNTKINDLNFLLKMISLRTLYKTFGDIFIYIFGLNEKELPEKKFDIINNYLNNRNNENVRELKMLLNDIKELLMAGNYEVHFINFNEDLLTQLLDIVLKYNSKDLKNNQKYQNISKYLMNTNIGNYLNKLVGLRYKKYSTEKKEFNALESDIINNIKKDNELKCKFAMFK